MKGVYTPIIPLGINPSIGIGPTQGQRKTLTLESLLSNATEGQQLTIT